MLLRISVIMSTKYESFQTIAVNVIETLLSLTSSGGWVLDSSWRLIWCTPSGQAVQDTLKFSFSILITIQERRLSTGPIRKKILRLFGHISSQIQFWWICLLHLKVLQKNNLVKYIGMNLCTHRLCKLLAIMTVVDGVHSQDQLDMQHLGLLVRKVYQLGWALYNAIPQQRKIHNWFNLLF